jgi:putative FmdB family regulatory protein
MPIYEYQCTKCGRIVEAWQGFSDAPLKTCKHCSGRLHKLISQSTFHLKGTGWYVTDYANKSTSASSTSRGKGEKSGGKGKKPETESASKKKEE